MNIVGVDVGGTFTDIVLVDASGRLIVHKVLGTPEDPSESVLRGIDEILALAGLPAQDLTDVLHGTTIATNAILEHRGDDVGMLTSAGYRDIVQIGRHQRPQHYSIQQEIPWQDRPLSPRRLRHPVRGRLAPPHGEELQELSLADVDAAIAKLQEQDAKAVAVCFLFSYLNPEHERRAAERVRQRMPGVFVSCSAEVSAQYREFERFTTTLINAFVGPAVGRYVGHLQDGLRSRGVGRELHVMRSNGGLATAETVRSFPVQTMLSGPAAGAVGGAYYARLAGLEKVITLDVGGTSADIAIVQGGVVSESSARDTSIAGYPLLVPMVDVHTIGAGGGSIAYVDQAGALRVGPKSAGADPGPACYGRGGRDATVTDAFLALGQLDPEHFLGGRMRLQPDAACAAILDLAARIGLGPEETAAGILTIVHNNMANAIHARTVQKGLDPRDFALVAFGGAGPLSAVEVSRLLQVPKVLVPPSPGITSAIGLLTSDVRYDRVQTAFLPAADASLEALGRAFAVLEAEVRGQLAENGFSEDGMRLERFAECRYQGQGYELRVRVGEVRDGLMAEIRQRFQDLHQQEYGHAFPTGDVEIVNVGVVGSGQRQGLPAPRAPQGGSAAAALLRTVMASFPQDGRVAPFETPVYERSLLPVGLTLEGPAILVQQDTTTVLPPGATARVDAQGCLLIERLTPAREGRR